MGVENFWILVLYRAGSSLIDPLIADWALYTEVMKLIITVIHTKYMVSSLEINFLNDTFFVIVTFGLRFKLKFCISLNAKWITESQILIYI